MSTGSAIEEAILSVCGYAKVGGAVGIGALVLVGVMTGPAGWAALGTLGVVAGVSVGPSIIVSNIANIEGSQ